MFNAQENTVTSPIATGDAGIIIKADGTPQIFNTYTKAQLESPTPEMTQTMQKLMALMVAWNLPPVMDVVMQVANDPAIVGSQIMSTGSLN
jgi:hypothetical protein